MAILDELLPLFDSTIDVQDGRLDAFGAWLASGTPVGYQARYEEGVRMVNNRDGRSVASSVFVIVAGVLPSHDVDRLRFTITSSRFDPWSELQAIRIDPISDETGVIAAEVSFP